MTVSKGRRKGPTSNTPPKVAAIGQRTEEVGVGNRTLLIIGASPIQAGGTARFALKARAKNGTTTHQSERRRFPLIPNQIRASMPKKSGSNGNDKRSGVAHSEM